MPNEPSRPLLYNRAGMRRRIVAAFLLFVAAACGYDSPSAPTPPPPEALAPSPTPTPEPVAPTALNVSIRSGGGNTGQPVWLTATVSSNARPFRYEWIFGDGSTAAHVLPDNFVDIPHTYGRAGTFAVKVTVSDAADRSGAGEAEISIKDPPPAPPVPQPVPPTPTYGVVVTANPNPVVAGLPTTLTATATPVNGAPGVTSFDWDCLGDGSFDATGQGNVYQCTYASAGAKTVSVVARNAGVSGTGTVSVTVNADALLLVGITPKIFHPAVGQLVEFTATVTSAGNIPSSLRWDWDYENDGTYDFTVSGANPNALTRAYGSAGVTKIKVRVTDPLTAREATSTLTFTVVP